VGKRKPEIHFIPFPPLGVGQQGFQLLLVFQALFGQSLLE
jgi:hypothetical protein